MFDTTNPPRLFFAVTMHSMAVYFPRIFSDGIMFHFESPYRFYKPYHSIKNNSTLTWRGFGLRILLPARFDCVIITGFLMSNARGNSLDSTWR